MPLYKIGDQQDELTLIESSTFMAVGMQERKDLQALLRDNRTAIDPNLLVFAEEFSSWQESLRRIDLLALDRDANLVVIELKRVEEGGHMDLQAIRYAAMVSAMSFEDVVKAYEKLLSDSEISEKHGISPTEARQALLNFLDAPGEEEVMISPTPRIILMSPSFSKEITTTVLWLNGQGLDVRCLEVNPYELGGEIYLSVEQVIPLPSAESYVVQMGKKLAKAKRREKSIPALVAHGILKPNTRLYLIKPPRPDLKVPEEARRATFLDSQKAQWDHDGKDYSLSALCTEICKEFGGEVGSGAFAGPDYWAIEGQTVALSELARNLNSFGDGKSHG